MKIRQNKGRVVHSTLSFVWQVMPMGGSLLQKYDAPSSSYIPNRALTPLVLQPMLYVTDPDNSIPAADYASQMSNASWVLTLTSGGSTSTLPATDGDDTNYTVDSSTKALTLYYNVPCGATLHAKFVGDYVDGRRNENHHFEWERDLATEAQTDLNVVLDSGQWTNLVHLMPFKKWGNFGINVQLKNGPDAIPDSSAVYQWQWWDADNSVFSEDFSECAWLESGEQTKQIIVRQDYIQKVTLRCKAYAYGNLHTTQYFVTTLRRWYGQFDYDVEFLRGKYIFKNSDTVVLSAWVANAKGIISNPTKYFDMELFFGIGDNNLESVGYGDEAIITSSELQSGEPNCGILLRELSAFRILADENGKPLCMDDGTPISIQIPTKTREV